MNPATPSEETIFAAALERPPAERAAFLDTACAGDSALRARVEALLRAHDAARSFMESPPAADLASAVTQQAPRVIDAAVGSRIGRYKLLQKIGEGGCGVVFMAEQEEPVRRRVALKVIKLGMDTKEVVARFAAERQALALMDHAHIARVLDAGATDAGRLFFVMELVRGIPITKFCDEQNLPAAKRLELFTQVCHAVQHAHQKGIIHRDLKPSNILVTLHDGAPVPKVIDFGIAKATHGRLTDKTLFTAFEQFIGTPAYMSPEQAEMSGLDIDTRSDIYSLGVLLYELLTGRPPFDPKSLLSAGLDEIRRIIREVEPPRPSTRLSTLTDLERATIAKLRGILPAQHSTLLRGDLDWIVMRCLEKDRTRRYETANGLALDVLRHLHDESVVARPASAGYRFQKLVRRNKLAVGAAAAIAAALVIGLGFATWRYQREKSARAAETVARELAERRRTEVESINRFLVSDMLGSANPEIAQGREITVKEVLANAALRIPTAFADNPALEASIRTTIGETYSKLGAYEPAEPHLLSALETRRRFLGNDHPDTLLVQRALAVLRRLQSRREESERLLREVLTTQERVLGPADEQTIETMLALAHTLNLRGTNREAETLSRRALELSRRHFGAEHNVTLHALHMLAGGLGNMGRSKEAEPLHLELLTLQRKKLGAEHPDTLGTMHDYIASLNFMGRAAEAHEHAVATLEIMKRVNGPDDIHTNMVRSRLFAALRRLGRNRESTDVLFEMIASCRRSLPADHYLVMTYVNNLCRSLMTDQRAGEAVGLMRDQLAFARKSLPADHEAVTGLLMLHADALLADQRPAEAETVLRECLAIRERTMPDDWRRFVPLATLGGALLDQRKYADAENALLAGYSGYKLHEKKIPASWRALTIRAALTRLVRLHQETARPGKATDWQARLDEFNRPPPARPPATTSSPDTSKG